MSPRDKNISPTCECITNFHVDPVVFCGAPTAWWYPSLDGGTMALCEEHAKPHSLYVHEYRLAGPAAGVEEPR